MGSRSVHHRVPSGATAEAKTHNVLWRNNGNALHGYLPNRPGIDATALASSLPISTTIAPSISLCRRRSKRRDFSESREESFRRFPLSTSPKKSSASARCRRFDFDKDGWMDLLHPPARRHQFVAHIEGKRLERMKLPDLVGSRFGISAIDYDTTAARSRRSRESIPA